MIAFIRRQPTRYLWPVYLALGLVFLFSRGGQFRGSWLWTTDWSAGALILTGPIATAIAAWHAWFQMKYMREATALARRSLRSASSVFAGEIGLLLSAQLVVLTTAGVYTATLNHHVPWTALEHAVPQFFILVGFISAGAVAGFVVPSPLTAPLAGIAAYLIQLPAIGILPRALVKFGGATADPAGASARTSFDAAHVGFSVGLVVVAIAGSAWFATRRRPSGSVRVAVAGGVALLATSLVFLGVTKQDRFALVANSSECASISPTATLCVYRDLNYRRTQLAGLISEVIAVERRLGVHGLPTTLRVVAPGSDQAAYQAGETDRVMLVQGGDLNGTRVEQLKATLPDLLIDHGCLVAHMNTDLSMAIGDLQLAADYVLLELTEDRPTSSIAAVAALRDAPVEKRESWVRSVLSAGNACALSAMPAPLS